MKRKSAEDLCRCVKVPFRLLRFPARLRVLEFLLLKPTVKISEVTLS